MSNINIAAISGNLTRDPELRTFGEDGKVANLGVAVNRDRFNKETQEYDKEVSFIDVTVWGNFGDLVARKLRKGDLVSVQGRLEQQTWEKDGEKRSKIVIIADSIDSEGMFRSKDEETAPATASGGQPAEQTALPTETAAQPATAAPIADDDIPF